MNKKVLNISFGMLSTINNDLTISFGGIHPLIGNIQIF
jgi:hypothetical protein